MPEGGESCCSNFSFLPGATCKKVEALGRDGIEFGGLWDTETVVLQAGANLNVLRSF